MSRISAKTMPQTAILYDGQCLVCRQSVALIDRLDPHRAVLPIDLHNEGILADRYPTCLLYTSPSPRD